MLKGIGVSNGIAVGNIVKFSERPLCFEEHSVTDIVAEKQRFLNAVEAFCLNTNALASEMDETSADGQILRGYTVMIKDPYLTEHIAKLIEGGVCAELAVQSACDSFIRLFTDSTDELVRHRAADIEDIKRRMLEILLNVEHLDLKELPENTVLVTNELTPSMMVGICGSGVVGVIAEKGGRTSHSAIIARSVGLPTVLGQGCLGRSDG